MIDNFTDVLAFLVAICVLVAVHEFGHFYVARRCGVKVLRFSIGFGPRLIRWSDKLGTEYAISAIPLGGYVKMLGERDSETEIPQEEKHMAHDNKPVLQRIAIAIAGPLANFVLALLLYWFVFMQGTVSYKPVIGDVADGSIAQKAGLESGQEIVSLDGVAVRNQRDVVMALMDRLGESGEIQFSVKYPDSDYIYESRAILNGWLKGVEAPDPLEGVGIKFFLPSISLKISDIVKDGAAASAGLVAGDRILQADNQLFKNGREWIDYVRARPNTVMTLSVERAETEKTLQLQTGTRTLDSGEDVGFAGVILEYEPWPENMVVVQRHGVFGSLSKAASNTWETAGLSLLTMRKIIFGEISLKNLSGPIGIAKVAGDSGRAGVHSFVQFLAYMSIMLGVLNLLPIPMLDGGHVLFYTIEWLKGSPIPEKAQLFGYQVGLFMILGVMVVAFYNDVLRL